MSETPKISGMTRLRNYFLTGFIVCAPLAITAYIAWSFIGWVDSWVKPYIPYRYSPDAYLPFPVPGFGLIVALVLITLIGFLTANIVGRAVVGFGERLLGRMPLVRGIYGSLNSTPILNVPQVGILGMHAIQERPVARNGEVVIRPMMYLALSYDHRVIDGATAVQFLVKVKQMIEDPETLLIEG